jgi:hypothetical protein
VGNDTGADVLAAYQRRAQVRDTDRGIAMLRRLLHDWGPVEAHVERTAHRVVSMPPCTTMSRWGRGSR